MELLTAMYTMFSGSINPVRTESTAFKLHCGATAAMLVTFSVAVTTRQYVGNPIDCIHTRDIPEDVLNTYCWIHSTFTVEGRGQEAYPGVRGAGSSDPGGSKEGRRPAKYYQWVAFMLFFQVGLLLFFNTPFHHRGI